MKKLLAFFIEYTKLFAEKAIPKRMEFTKNKKFMFQ